jgi:hypothetical protein
MQFKEFFANPRVDEDMEQPFAICPKMREIGSSALGFSSTIPGATEEFDVTIVVVVVVVVVDIVIFVFGSFCMLEEI